MIGKQLQFTNRLIQNLYTWVYRSIVDYLNQRELGVVSKIGRAWSSPLPASSTSPYPHPEERLQWPSKSKAADRTERTEGGGTGQGRGTRGGGGDGRGGRRQVRGGDKRIDPPFFFDEEEKHTLSNIRRSRFIGSLPTHPLPKLGMWVVKRNRFDELYAATVSDRSYD